MRIPIVFGRGAQDAGARAATGPGGVVVGVSAGDAATAGVGGAAGVEAEQAASEMATKKSFLTGATYQSGAKPAPSVGNVGDKLLMTLILEDKRVPPCTGKIRAILNEHSKGPAAS